MMKFGLQKRKYFDEILKIEIEKLGDYKTMNYTSIKRNERKFGILTQLEMNECRTKCYDDLIPKLTQFIFKHHSNQELESLYQQILVLLSQAIICN